MGRVNVSNLEAGTLTGETTRTERRQTTTVGEPGERVGLVHELAQLACAEELLDRCGDRANVDQALRRDRIRILGSHPLADDPLQSGETHPNLVLNQLANRADAAIAEMIDVVGADLHLVALVGHHRRLAGMESHEVPDGIDDVLITQ